MKLVSAFASFEGMRFLFNTKPAQDLRTKIARRLAGEDKIGRELADEVLSELFAELRRIELSIDRRLGDLERASRSQDRRLESMQLNLDVTRELMKTLFPRREK